MEMRQTGACNGDGTMEKKRCLLNKVDSTQEVGKKPYPSNEADFHSGYICFESKRVFGELLASDIVVKDTKSNLS